MMVFYPADYVFIMPSSHPTLEIHCQLVRSGRKVHRKTLKQDRNSIIGEIVDTTYPYVRKTQRKARNERSRKFWVLPGAVSL